METNEKDWCVECSDDEKYENDPKEGWSLKPDDIINIINKLECNNNHILELEWKCPGRRPLSPVPSNNHQQDHLPDEFIDSLVTEEKDDFDFMDEMSSPRLPVRRIGESTPKGSAKKKTASFNGVVTNLLRQRRFEQQEINSNPKKNESIAPIMKPQST